MRVRGPGLHGQYLVLDVENEVVVTAVAACSPPLGAAEEARNRERPGAATHDVHRAVGKVVGADIASAIRVRCPGGGARRGVKALVPVIMAIDHDIDVMAVHDLDERSVLVLLVRLVADVEERVVRVDGLVEE